MDYFVFPYRQYFIVFILFCLACPLRLLAGYIDLEEELESAFVLETKKIEIPYFPNGFNPSIIDFKDTFLMSFRTGSGVYASDPDPDSLLMSFRFHDPLNGSTNEIGLVILDKDFNVIGDPQILQIPRENPFLAFRQQDPRLIKVGNRIFVVYSNIIEGVVSQEIRRMFVAEIFYDGSSFTASMPECLSGFEGENQCRWQKNWAPFEYEGRLLLSYSINPHRVMYPFLDGSEVAATVSSTLGKIDWDLGDLRGGTQALLDNDEYLGFFHSTKEMKTAQSKGKKISHYFMGAYTFQKKPPFALTKISPQPIVGKGFYNGPLHNTWKPLRVVFPGGFVLSKDFVWIAYGRQDHEIWIVKLDKQGLMKSLVSVPPLD